MQIRHYRNHSGFTLLELIITLAIVFIIFSIAVPGLGSILDKSRADSTVHTIYRIYQTARTLAINNNTDILLCGSNDEEHCEKIWSKNIIVFEDLDKNRKPSFGEIIKIHAIDLPNGYITSRIAFGKKYTLFSPIGRAKFTGSMIICFNKDAAHLSRRVTWSGAGRPYFGRDINRDGIVDDTNGKPIACS